MFRRIYGEKRNWRIRNPPAFLPKPLLRAGNQPRQAESIPPDRLFRPASSALVFLIIWILLEIVSNFVQQTPPTAGFIILWYTGKVIEQYKRRPNAACSRCGKNIYRRPVEIQRNNGRVFCSMACYGISCRKEIPCAICKKPILSGLHRITCSKACSNKHRTGVKYKLHRPRDKVTSQRALKIRLIRVRGRNCERCGYGKYEILQIHHKDKNKNNNDLLNLELICPNCHFEEHYFEKSWMNKDL